MFPMWKGMSYRAIKIGKDKSSSFYGNNFFINKSHSSKTHNVFFLPWFASVHIYTHFIHLHCKSRRVTVSCLGERSEVKTAERGNVGPLGFRVCSDAGRHWRFGSPENQLEVPRSKRNSRDSRVCLFCVRSSMTLLPFSGWTSTSFSPFQNNILVFVCFRRTLLDFDISTILKWSSILVPCLLYSKHKKDRTHIYHYLSRIFTTYFWPSSYLEHLEVQWPSQAALHRVGGGSCNFGEVGPQPTWSGGRVSETRTQKGGVDGMRYPAW